MKAQKPEMRKAAQEAAAKEGKAWMREKKTTGGASKTGGAATKGKNPGADKKAGGAGKEKLPKSAAGAGASASQHKKSGKK